MPNCTHQRRGAVMPMFAILLPVLLIFCSMAINLAYVQLANTEMQIAVDVAVHAGGRRLGTLINNPDGSIQTLDEAKSDVVVFAAEIAAMNNVAGSPATIPVSAMEFGRSTRQVKDNGQFASYVFNPIAGDQIPSSFRIISNDLELPYVFGFAPTPGFTVNAASVSTQVDRDVVLVIDRSGSMNYFEDEDQLNDTLDDLREESNILYEYRVQWRRDGSSWKDSSHGPYMTEPEFVSYPDFPSRNEYRLNLNNQRVRSADEKKITQEEYDHARNGRERSSGAWTSALYHRWYSSNLIYWLEVTENPDTHTLGNSPATWTSGLTIEQQRALLTGHMALYAHDFRYQYRLNDHTLSAGDDLDSRRAADYSRWYHLERGVSVFLNVLGGGVDPDGKAHDGTVQKEQIAILPFNRDPNNETDSSYHESEFDYGLQGDGFPAAFVSNSNDPGYAEPYSGSTLSLRDILGTICPYDGTAIGDSLREAVHVIRTPTDADPTGRGRSFAAKTIVVLTDGDNTVGDDPVTVAEDEIAHEDVLVHTITFTPGVSDAGKAAMTTVADYGKGKHYHTDLGEELSVIFEQIANNLPTKLTE